MELLTTLRTAFPVLGAVELESIGCTCLNQKVPIHWQNKLDELHQKDLQTATFSHDRDHCLIWEKSDAVHAQKKQIKQNFLDTELEKKGHVQTQDCSGFQTARNSNSRGNQDQNQTTPVRSIQPTEMDQSDQDPILLDYTPGVFQNQPAQYTQNGNLRGGIDRISLDRIRIRFHIE